MSVGPQITAGPPRGFTAWRNGPSLDVILTKARARGWEVKTQQTLQEAQLATIVRGPISATSTVSQSGDRIANVTRDEESMKSASPWGDGRRWRDRLRRHDNAKSPPEAATNRGGPYATQVTDRTDR